MVVVVVVVVLVVLGASWSCEDFLAADDPLFRDFFLALFTGAEGEDGRVLVFDMDSATESPPI